MKILITASDAALDSALDPRFGRAPHFILVDTDSNQSEVIDNQQNLNAAQGAGIQAAQNVCTAGADAIITGHVGPKAFRALQAAGIRVYLSEDKTVQDALDSFRNGALAEAGAHNVKGHWV